MLNASTAVFETCYKIGTLSLGFFAIASKQTAYHKKMLAVDNLESNKLIRYPFTISTTVHESIAKKITLFSSLNLNSLDNFTGNCNTNSKKEVVTKVVTQSHLKSFVAVLKKRLLNSDV